MSNEGQICYLFPQENKTMKTINRNSIIVKPKQPFVDWINAQPD
jgi:hypothetical protein